jgi:hypothetical protein
MNTEIVRRLHESFLAKDDPTTIIAKALLEGLDDGVVETMVETVLRDRADDAMADAWKEDQRFERERDKESK